MSESVHRKERRACRYFIPFNPKKKRKQIRCHVAILRGSWAISEQYKHPPNPLTRKSHATVGYGVNFILLFAECMWLLDYWKTKVSPFCSLLPSFFFSVLKPDKKKRKNYLRLAASGVCGSCDSCYTRQIRMHLRFTIHQPETNPTQSTLMNSPIPHLSLSSLICFDTLSIS